MLKRKGLFIIILLKIYMDVMLSKLLLKKSAQNEMHNSCVFHVLCVEDLFNIFLRNF